MNKIKLVILLFFVAFAVAGCSLVQLVNVVNCQFQMNNITNIRWAGINFSQLNSINDLSFANAKKAATAIYNKDFKVDFTVNINAKNNSKTVAKLSGFDYILFLDDKELCHGNNPNTSYIINPNGGIATIGVPVSVDLTTLLTSQNVESIVTFIKNVNDFGNGTPSKISVKFRPYLTIGKSVQKLPYININKTFQ